MKNAIVLTSAVVGLTQAFKIAGVPSRYSPTLAVIIGLIMQLALDGLSAENAIIGIVIGLSAVGLYESGSRLGNNSTVSPQEEMTFLEHKNKV